MHVALAIPVTDPVIRWTCFAFNFFNDVYGGLRVILRVNETISVFRRYFCMGQQLLLLCCFENMPTVASFLLSRGHQLKLFFRWEPFYRLLPAPAAVFATAALALRDRPTSKPSLNSSDLLVPEPIDRLVIFSIFVFLFCFVLLLVLVLLLLLVLVFVSVLLLLCL